MIERRIATISLFLKSLIVVFGIVLVAACDAAGPKPTPEISQAVTPTIESTITSTPAPTFIPVVDNGQAIAPIVVGRSPAGGQTASLNKPIEISFDQAMDQSSTANALIVLEAGASLSDRQPVPGQVAWSDTKHLLFTPTNGFKSGARYFVNLSEKATSSQGRSLKEAYDFDFVTASPLEISQVLPALDTEDVALNTAIVVTFNRPVVPLVIAEQQDALPKPLTIEPAVEGKGEWLNSSAYVFRPAKNFQGGTQYRVSVAAGLQDAQKETSLAEPYSWTFHTAMPSLAGFSFTDFDWENYPMPKNSVKLRQSFFFRFHQAMDPSSTETNVTLVSQTGESAPLSFDWRENGTQLVFTPTLPLAMDTRYTIHLGKQAQVEGGGSGLDYDFDYSFKTVSYPAILYTTPSNGESARQFDSTFTIHFASPMKFNTWKDKITIDPAPEGGTTWYYNPDDYYGEQWTLNLSGLQSSTNYAITIQPGLEDVYGNAIKVGQTIRFHTGPYPPTAFFQMPQGLVLYRAGGPQDFYIGLRNVTRADVRLYKLPLKTYADLYNYTSGINEYNFTPPQSDLIWSQAINLSSETDQRTLRQFQPASAGKDRLDAGLYYLVLNAPQVESYGNPFTDHRIVMVAGTNISLKVSPSEALAWLTDLQDGKPLANLNVVFYDVSLKEIGRAISGPDGIAKIEGLSFDPSSANQVYALVDDSNRFGFASSAWGSGVSPYDFGIWQDYYSRPSLERTYVYTDRPLYRPGQPVYYKGILRTDDDGSYSLSQSRTVRVTITDYNNTAVFSDTLPVNEFGSFNGKFSLDQNATLGVYSINVYSGVPVGKLEDQQVIGGVSFNVAEYKKPEFIVDVQGRPQKALPNQALEFTVQSDYYAGGPLADAEVYWNLQSQPFTYNPPDEYTSYTFWDGEWDIAYDFLGGQQPAKSLSEGKTRTDASGKAIVDIPASLGDKGASQTLVFESGVTDFAGVSVYGRNQVVVNRSQVYPGIRSQAYVSEVKKPAAFDLVALDWDGKPIAGQKVDITIVERHWNNVQSVDSDGRIKWESNVEEIPVSAVSGLALDDKGKGQTAFTPDHGGVYRITIKARDALGNIGQASVFIWVAGVDYIPWRQGNNKGFDLVKDKTQYNPGDKASILIASPFNEAAYALVTVERGHIRKSEVILLNTNSTIYRLPITEDMAPGVYISVLIIHCTSDSPPDFRLGITELKVKPSAQALQVKLKVDKSQASPGDKVTYSIQVTDYLGKPQQAEVSLSLSDLAVLNLADANSGPILDFFYYKRNLSVTTSVPLVFTVEDYNAQLARDAAALGYGMGSGGGKGYGEQGIIPVRGRFLDTAYWNANVVTGADGNASVSVELPDNLTTWRMDARAVTKNTLAGQAQLDLISTKSLLVRPETPRFFTAGDEVLVGAAIHNNTGMPLDVNVDLNASGVSVLDAVSQKVSIANGKQSYITWKVRVNQDADRVDMVFSAQGGAFSDASKPPLGTLDNQGLPVYRYEVPESISTGGQLLQAGTAVESLFLPQGWNIQAGELDIQIAPTLAAGMTDSLVYLETYPYACIEQTISSFLPNVVSTRALHDAGLSNPDLEKKLADQVNGSLQRLSSLQNPDGGWGWWSTGKSDPTTSAYTYLGLVEAQEAGYAVDQSMVETALQYLQQNTLVSLDGKKKDPEVLNQQAFILFVLARGGNPAISNMSQLYEFYRQDLGWYARALLAESLWRQNTADERLKTLTSDLTSAAMVSATGTHWEETYSDRFNWNSDTRTTAIVVEALSQIDPNNPINANAVRWLMNHRQNGHWNGTQETAWSVMALSRWMTNSGELKADYKFAVAFNGQVIGGGDVSADNMRQSVNLRVMVSDFLKQESNRLAISRSDGNGNLYYTAHLNVFLPVDQVIALDQGIQIQRQYFHPNDLNAPVTEAKQGDSLVVRLTISSAEALHYIVVNDPLPAGLEAIDTSLKTSPTPEIPLGLNPISDGWGWWYFEHVELRDEKVVLSTNYLPAGSYTYTYMVRASLAGNFKVVPPTAQEFYFPEVYGRGNGSQFIVNP